MKEPTVQQQTAINYDSNCVITACPGSGKTYTIIEKIKRQSKDLKNYQGIIAISFTNKAAQEIKNRLRGEKTTNFFVGTIDSFYLSEIIYPFSKYLTNNLPEEYELSSQPNENINNWSFVDSTSSSYDYFLNSLRSGLIFLDKVADTALFILLHVPESVTYLKAKYKMIFVDEYQDCSDKQHIIWKCLVNKGLILVAVGDIDQSIFGFNGSNPQFLQELLSSPNFCNFQLTINHRSHKSIVDYATKFLNEGYVIEDPTPEKRVTKVRVSGNEEQIANQLDARLEGLLTDYDIRKRNEVVVLCKSNDMVERISHLLEFPHKAHTKSPFANEGDFEKLCSDVLSNYFLYKSKEISMLDFVDSLVKKEKNKELYRTVKHEMSKIFIKDERNLEDTITYFSYLGSLLLNTDNNINELLNIINDPSKLAYFKPATENQIQIMTYHKSKGLEFDLVIMLDCYKYIFPYEYNGSYGNDFRDSENLHYVGLTRAKKAVYIMLGTSRFRPRSQDFTSAQESIFISRHELDSIRNNLIWE